MSKQIKKILNILLILILAALSAYIFLNLSEGQSATAPEVTEPYKDMFMLEVIDCGQGDSILIDTPEGDTILVDTADTESRADVLAELKKLDPEDIDLLVATHPHADHIGSTQYILEHYPVDEILLTTSDHPTATYQNMLKAAERLKIKKIYARAGETMTFGSLKIEILGPVKKYDDLNDMSIVLRLTYGKSSFLLTGDAEKKAEKDMLKKFKNVRSDVLKVGHHGSSTSTSASLLKAVNPGYAVISVGKGNDYGHPHKETLNLLNKYNIKTYRTDTDGDVYFYSDGQSITVRTN